MTNFGKDKAQLCIVDPPWGLWHSEKPLEDPVWSEAQWSGFAHNVTECMRSDGLIFVFATHDMYHNMSVPLSQKGWVSGNQPLVWVKLVSDKGLQMRKQPHNGHCLIFVFHRPRRSANGTPQDRFHAHIDRQEESKNGFRLPYHTILECAGITKSEWRMAIDTSGEVKKDEKFRRQQKPLKLLLALNRRYAVPNAVIIDACCGTGSTGMACRNSVHHGL